MLAPMSSNTSFYDWLAKQKALRTPLGDFARKAAGDQEFPRTMATEEEILTHVRATSAGSGQALAVARAAYRAYARSIKPAARL